MDKRIWFVLMVTFFLSWNFFSLADPTVEDLPIISAVNVTQLENLLNIESAGGDISEITFDSSSQFIAVASWEGVLLWDLEQQSISWRLPVRLASQLMFSPNGEELVVAAYPSLYLWQSVDDLITWHNLKDGEEQSVGSVGDVQFSSDGSQVIALLTQSRGIYRWETDTLELLFEQTSPYVDESTAVTESMLSSDGQLAGILSYPRGLEIIDTSQGDTLSNPIHSNSGLILLTFSYDNEHLLLNDQPPSRSLNSSLVLVCINGEIESRMTFDYETIWVTGAYSPDGELLALANEVNNSIHFFDATSMNEITRIDIQTNGINTLAFSPDGRLLASGGVDGIVRLWGIPADEE